MVGDLMMEGRGMEIVWSGWGGLYCLGLVFARRSVMSMFESFTNSGGVDVLSRVMTFAGQRHRLLVNNIANLSTPNYLPKDVDPKAFEAELARAIEERNGFSGGKGKEPLPLQDTKDVHFTGSSLILDPKPVHQGILFHDQNDRNLERSMQSLVENVMVYRQSAELLQSRFNMMQNVIRERA